LKKKHAKKSRKRHKWMGNYKTGRGSRESMTAFPNPNKGWGGGKKKCCRKKHSIEQINLTKRRLPIEKQVKWEVRKRTQEKMCQTCLQWVTSQEKKEKENDHKTATD